MEKVIKYQLYCTAEATWKTVILEEGQPAPTTCPTDTSHGVQAGSVSAVDEMERDEVLTEQKLAVGGKKLQVEGFKFTAPANSTKVHSHKLERDILIADGFMHTDAANFDDSFSIELVDVDNILGYGAGFVLHPYAINYPVDPSNTTRVVNSAVTETNLKFLYFRVTYVNTGANPVKCHCGINGRKP